MLLEIVYGLLTEAMEDAKREQFDRELDAPIVVVAAPVRTQPPADMAGMLRLQTLMMQLEPADG